MEDDRVPVPMYTPDFSDDPHKWYREVRKEHGPLPAVELFPHIPATLVLDQRMAREIMNDAEHFPRDPRDWQETVPPDHPILGMAAWQDTARFLGGWEHDRSRAAILHSIRAVDHFDMSRFIETDALELVNRVTEKGCTELIGDYFRPLTLRALNRLIGCTDEVGLEIALGMDDRFDTSNREAVAGGMRRITRALDWLIAHKRDNPGPDMITGLLSWEPDPIRFGGNAVPLTDAQVLATLMSYYGAGFEAGTAWAANTMELWLTDEEFNAGLLQGHLPIDDALDWALHLRPPLANFVMTYPRWRFQFHKVWIPAHQPVVISIEGCALFSEIDVPEGAAGAKPGPLGGNRSHFAFGGGSHRCPAPDLSRRIAHAELMHLIDAFPDIRLDPFSAQLLWRPGPFQRVRTAMPCRFAAAPPMNPPARLAIGVSQPKKSNGETDG
jgi:cytochrome P450